ncbi:uncharacterized protein LOC102795839 [Neolamprologus brichardi]|uniref:uncharacterized protein LOC102795839 n=1 Tax=Neolamprologus brichardi TaxID=32507 RepID=UPI001643EE98|nr:uncharacterized protein LOC102795839 [Neolamprologus brichardi]
MFNLTGATVRTLNTVVVKREPVQCSLKELCAFPSPVCLSSLGLKGERLVLLGRSQYSLCLSLTEGAAVSRRLQLIDDLSYEDVKKCYRGSTVSKYNSQYHKLFQAVPKEEVLMKAYSCALLRDILLQGRLYISRNWLCFYANLFGKDIKVCIPVVSVRLVKKHKTAGLVPNGLAITMDTGQKEEPPGSLHFFTGVSAVCYLSVSLRVFLLVLSSCYLAFRVCRLEQQLSFLSSQPTLRERCGEVPCWLANQKTGT